MAYKDLREYIARLEQEGEVQRIEEEVDWNLELAAIVRRSHELRAPAPFFQKVKGYPPGYRVFGAPLGPSGNPGRYWARFALALGLRPDLSTAELIEEYVKLNKRRPVKPVVVTDAPCQEVVRTGSEADLLELPVPLFHQNDGGRYIGTWHTVISKDQDTGWVNWGVYRMMVHDSRTLGIFFQHPSQHMLLQYRKCEARGEPLPFAVAIGTEPVTTMLAGMRYPRHINEAEFFGAFREEPLELVKCKTVDLEVPATAEIVIEGELLPHERRSEGPFGEYTGYAVAEVAPRPVGRVKAITFRHDPILSVVCIGVPMHCVSVMGAIARSARILDDLRSRGVPVRMVYSIPESAGQIIAVSTKAPFANYARHLATVMWGGIGRCPYLVVVNDDIDVTDIGQVLWAIATRCNPAKGIFTMPDLPGFSMSPFLSRKERELGLGGASTLFDCLWPSTWAEEDIPAVTSFETMAPPELLEKVVKSWARYGYKE
ncbi:MAG: UbiD family decarboxylase [Pseudomonadota bacterium]